MSRTESILAGKTTDVELNRRTACTKSLAQLAIDCEVPAVEVEVVGVTKARTPLDAPLLVPVGDVVIQFRRRGYGEVARRVRLRPQAMTRVTCGQRALQPLPASISARLVVQRRPESAKVFVDGQPFAGGALPAGPHEIVVAHDGFVPTRRVISLEATKTLAFSAELARTPEQLARDHALASMRRNWGLALAGTGVAFLGSAGGLYAWNSQRYTDWRDRATLDNGQANLGLATSIQHVDDLTVAFALLGLGITGAGAWLFFTPE